MGRATRSNGEKANLGNRGRNWKVLLCTIVLSSIQQDLGGERRVRKGGRPEES